MKWVMKDPDFLVRKAEPSDLASVLFLLQQAGRWLQTKNTTQWDYYVTDLQENTEEVSDSIDRENTYIVESDNGECVASITLEMAPQDGTALSGEMMQKRMMLFICTV
ncbi:hypothetical protein [Sediminibacillus sp. JSM 1682029]|uniref:hypothetical protein n=1 Tax=Sediminibacillus sp. JSM 1682029 TaxID=3229857 RepID=UPI003525B9E9